MKQKPEVTLRVRALRHLARREHSRAELRTKLLPFCQTEDDLEALLDDLTQQNWLSDSRVAEHIVNHRRAKFGIQRIAHELRQKGLDEALIANALPQLKESESETARSLWQKKFGKPPQDDKEKAKQIRFLQSRGFSLDVILRVIRSSEYEQ